MKYNIVAPFARPLSAIGLGCVTFGREIDEKASFAVMDYAFDKGISLFDTAAAYGGGASETIIGKWLAAKAGSADLPVVATKVSPPFNRANMMQSVHGSLQRLGRDTIDLLYLHRWDASCQLREALDTLEHLTRSGKIRAAGVSNFDAAQLQEMLARQTALAYAPLRAIQQNRNLAVNDVSPELLDVCTENRLALITYSPLGAGFLTGKYLSGLPGHTRFSVIPGHQDVYFHERARKRLEKLLKIAARINQSPVHLALAWALQQPGAASVLVGGRTVAHLEQALRALEFEEKGVLAELGAG